MKKLTYVEPKGYINKDMKKILEQREKEQAPKPAAEKTVKK